MKRLIKNNYFQFGKSLFNRLICLFKGHEFDSYSNIVEPVNDTIERRCRKYVCPKCGKVKYGVVIEIDKSKISQPPIRK